MATSDVEVNSEEESILYDLTCPAEWKQENEVFKRAASGARETRVSVLGRVTSTTQRTIWTALRSVGLPIQTASPCYLPPGLVKLVNCSINWSIAVTSDGRQVAILQDQHIEIRSRRDDFLSVTGRFSVQRDAYPQWCHLVWSPDSTMLACSYSCGKVQVYDIVGTLLFTIKGKEMSQNSKLPTDLSEAVAALIFTDVKQEDKEWSAELMVINYHGNLKKYKVDRDNGFKLQHSFLFNNVYPLGISNVVYHEEAGLLYVGGSGQEYEGVSEAMRAGLTVWRILSDYPHYKLVTDYAEDLNKSKQQGSWKQRFKLPSMSYFKGDNLDGIYKLSLSPDRKHLAAVHCSGKLTLWSVPGLKEQRSWTQDQQPFCDEISPEFTENPQLRNQVKDLVLSKQLLDINWWSNEAVILARGTGAVTVSSRSSLKNLLGIQPEWFEPAPKVSPVHDGGFLGLEVECRFPSKRRLVPTSEDEDDESDEEEAGLVAASWGVAKQCIHYVTDIDRFKPPKKKPKLVNRTYRLVCLKSTTPEELFARKLENEEYGEAKALAQAYGLDTDLVYQRQWRKSPVELSSVQDYLSKISKRSWVLHECLERMSDQIDAMKGLLEFGLRGTDLQALVMIGAGDDHGRFILCDPEDGLYEDMELDDFDPDIDEKKMKRQLERRDELIAQVNFDNLTLEQRELCRARKKLVQYLYRLKTYECILGGAAYAPEKFDQKFFEKFRSSNIVEIAVSYAQSSDWKALDTLFTFHGAELMPHRLTILSNFPETTCPTEYKSLLPEVSDGVVLSWPTDHWEIQDWVEIDPCKSAIEPVHHDVGEYLYEDQSHLSQFRGDLEAATLTSWYQFRAQEIERLSRQADSALQFVKLGIERGVEKLEDIMDDLIIMEMLIYSCHVDDTLTFARLQEMADYDKLEMIMSKSSDDMYSKNLRKWLVPFLRQCERRNPGSYSHLLHDYIVTMATKDLTRPLQVFEASKTHLPNPVILKQSELMSVTIEAIYSCGKDDQLKLAMDILACLPKPGYGADTKEIKKLRSHVDKLKHHLNAAKILAENEIKKPIYYIRDSESNANEAEQLMTKLTRVVSRRESVVSEAQWSKLHGDMMELQDTVYRCLSPRLCHEIFVESLLCSSNLTYIQLAGHLIERTEEESHTPTPVIYNMQTKVAYQRAIELVLAAAQEYFNSSANLTDLCMGLARSCLNLIQDNPPRVLEESDLISSLTLLAEFSVSVLPLQVRLSNNRIELVKQALENRLTTYKSKQKLLRLGHLLRISATDRVEREGKVLHLVARAAFKALDFPFTWEVCNELMGCGHGPAWDVCVDLATHEGFQNVNAKVELLSFAVTFCTPDMIEPILQARALLETQVLFEGISSESEDSPADDTGRHSSPFSTHAAIQQTQYILSSTQQTTKAVLSTVTDAKWWQGTVNRLKQPATQRQVSHDLTNRNRKLELQACHPFYEGLMQKCYVDVDEFDLRHMETNINPATVVSEKLLRTAQLEGILTEGEKSQPATEVLLQLANETFTTDHTLSLAYLLALKQPLDADRCFEDSPKTDISLQLAVYYYALQLYANMKPSNASNIDRLYLQNPVKVMQKVTSLLSQKKDFDWPEGVVAVVTKIKHYSEMLEDYRQARALKALGRGIDVDRFAADPEYKRETILGLAMNLEDSIYNISLSLAERYGITLWEIYAAHLEFLFTDSGLSTEMMETRVTKLNILSTLKSRPAEFCERMTTYVYPCLSGMDQNALLCYYTMLCGCDTPLQGGLVAETHVKLLKKLATVSTDIDYKSLMDEKANVIDVLSPCLTSANITTVAKIAKQIPDGHGGTLEGSIVYCTWAVKYFWEGNGKKEPENMVMWMHRFEECGEFYLKLNTQYVLQFLQAVIFTNRSRTLLETECRKEICRRLLKFCRQQMGRKKRQESEKEITWENLVTTINGYIKHLESLSNPVVMVMSQSEVTRVQEYLEIYDLSMGVKEKVNQLVVDMVIEGDLPLESVNDFFSVVPAGTWTLKTILHDAIEVLLQALRNEETAVAKTVAMETVPKDTLKSVQTVVHNVQEHMEEGGDLVTPEDVLAQLRPFCSDKSVPVQPRLDVLYILEKSFKLSDDECVLLTLYRTQAVVTPVWSQQQVTEENISSPESRLEFFSTLLEKSSKSAKKDNSCNGEFTALSRLLNLWPPFPSTRSDEETPWVSLLKAMVTSGCHDNIALVLETVKTTKDLPLVSQDAEMLFRAMLDQSYPLDAVRFCLLIGQEDLFPVAVETLSNLPQISEDSELILALLKYNLVPSLVPTPHYPIIIQYVIANENPESESPDLCSVQRLANQLRENGYKAEAGSLFIQAARPAHPMLQTFGAALGSIGKLFK